MAPTRSSRALWARRIAGVAVVALAASVLVVAVGPGTALAAPEEDLAAAQERADRAAEELADAEEDMARAQDAVAHLQSRVDDVDARVGRTRAQVSELAIRLYVDGTVPIIRILRMGDANEVVRAQQYSHVIAGGSTDSLRQYRADREELREELAALERQRATHADSLENLQERRADAIAEIEELGRVLAQARAAQEAERRAEAAAADADRQSPDGSSPDGQSPDGSSPDRQSPDGQSADGQSPEPSAGSAAPGSLAPPAASSSPGPADPESPVGSGVAPDWICPVQGPLAFSNDYGAPRGGGSSHQGNDILAPRGTPVVASVDGDVRHRSGAVSGLAYYLDGDDGIEYFGAHLDSLGESGRVSAGTVVGTVGNTGDAASTAPHLHFEMHPGGGNVNPFSTLTRYC